MSNQPTQRFDPNRTQLNPGGAPADPNRTQAMTGLALNQTQVMTGFAPSEPGISARLVPSREATMANGPAREQFLVEIAAGTGVPTGMGVSSVRTPLNLCLVIDRSGSMEGAPLQYVKQACSHVVDLMGPNDILSIVTFEETVDVLMAPQRVTSKQPIKDGIARLQPGNTTNLYDGLLLGSQQVLSVTEAGRATRMVVLSDGDPTAGIKDFSALVAQAGEIKNRGVTVTFLGFGPDYNEELLAGMAKRASGNYYYIPSPELIPEVFRAELDKLMSVAARNMNLTVKPARWVELRGPVTAQEGQEVSIALTDLERGGAIQQVLDFEFRNHPLGWYRVAAGRISYEDLEGGGMRTVDLDFVIEFTADAARYSTAPNPEVSGAAQLAAASRVVEKTVMGLKTGAITQMGAVAELQKTQMLLVQQGRVQDAQEVTRALQALQSGDAAGAEKTLMGTIVHLDQGKK
jgi:Ca-activated chloride channel family protein